MLCIDVALTAVLIFSLENFIKEKKQFNREFSAKKKSSKKKSDDVYRLVGDYTRIYLSAILKCHHYSLKLIDLSSTLE